MDVEGKVVGLPVKRQDCKSSVNWYIITIKNKWMREQMLEEIQNAMKKTGRHNPHRLDEAPKNRPSKYITTRCPNAAWLQESTAYGGHKIPKGGYRKVSGIVRAKTKEEIREEIQLED